MTTTDRALLIIVLAAGKGTRMKSAVPKVLHQVGGRSLVGHVLASAAAAGATRLVAVVGPGMENVRKEVERQVPGATAVVQPDQLGTADAVRAARAEIAAHAGDVVVLLGDTPLLTAATVSNARQSLLDGADVTVVGFRAADPTGYGRVLTTPDGTVAAIREHKDASAEERAVTLCNSGVIGFRGERFLEILDEIRNDNAKGEYYLTDAIEIARAKGLVARVIEASEEEVMGINDRSQLAAAEAAFQRRRRSEAMLGGATLVAPETVHFSFDTRLGQDVVVEPYVVFGPGVTIADRVTIKAFSHLTGTDSKVAKGTSVAEGAEIGPYARLRPGAAIGANAHIGNFVEVKNVTVGAGAKANHLAYLGDGRVGEGSNIGAGTIFCNYDGFSKHETTIGDGVFVGSNSSLVAPVRIGDGAYIGSGSVITRDVAPGALALERAKQEERPGWADKFRAVMKKRTGKG